MFTTNPRTKTVIKSNIVIKALAVLRNHDYTFPNRTGGLSTCGGGGGGTGMVWRYARCRVSFPGCGWKSPPLPFDQGIGCFVELGMSFPLGFEPDDFCFSSFAAFASSPGFFSCFSSSSLDGTGSVK